MNHSHCERTAYPSTCTCHWNCHSSGGGKRVQIVWIKLWLSVVLHSLYWKEDNFGVTPHLKKHTKNSSSSETFWTYTPQCQLTCGWINIIILQALLGLKACNTNCVVTVKINRKLMLKELWESKFQTDKVTMKMNFCVLRWPDIKT